MFSGHLEEVVDELPGSAVPSLRVAGHSQQVVYGAYDVHHVLHRHEAAEFPSSGNGLKGQDGVCTTDHLEILVDLKQCAIYSSLSDLTSDAPWEYC